MQKIIVLDFTTSEVHVFPYDINIYEEIEDFIEEQVSNQLISKVSNCQWMVVEELILKIQNI